MKNETNKTGQYYFAVLDRLGYISYCGSQCGCIPRGSEEITKEQYEELTKDMQKMGAYRLVDGELIFDSEKYKSDVERISLDDIRHRRELECFPVINRGFLWYDRLTPEQTDILNTWYQAWLDAPQTGMIPETPAWIEVI